MIDPIRVWRFYDAPAELRAISHHGGDEDWLAEVPPSYDDVPWMDEGTAFGRCDVQTAEHPTRDGWTVAIGAHS